jgi:hypothetical protein
MEKKVMWKCLHQAAVSSEARLKIIEKFTFPPYDLNFHTQIQCKNYFFSIQASGHRTLLKLYIRTNM